MPDARREADQVEALAWIRWFMDAYDMPDHIRTAWGVHSSQAWPVMTRGRQYETDAIHTDGTWDTLRFDEAMLGPPLDLEALDALIRDMPKPEAAAELHAHPVVAQWLRDECTAAEPPLTGCYVEFFAGIPVITDPDMEYGAWEIRRGGEVVESGKVRIGFALLDGFADLLADGGASAEALGKMMLNILADDDTPGPPYTHRFGAEPEEPEL